MKKLLLIGLVSVFICNISFAQEPLETQVKNAKFRIIRSTVIFVANVTDNTINTKPIEDAKTIASLTDFTKKNQTKLVGLELAIKRWNVELIVDFTPDGYLESLNKFKTDIATEITKGGKKIRKEGSNAQKFVSYNSNVDKIINGIAIPQNTENQANTESEQDKPLDTNETFSAKEDQMSAEVNLVEQPSDETPKSAFSFAIILLYILAVISLAGLFILYRFIQVKIADQEIRVKNLIEGFSLDFKRLQNEVQVLRTENKNNSEDFVNLKNELSKRISNIVQNNASPPLRQNNTGLAPPPTPRNEPTIKYAKYADQGDGFSASELINEEDNETIFEITIISPSSAKLRVAGNINAQRYALTNPNYFLARVCKSENIPSNNSSIRTDIAGELKLVGNKWVIVTPAKISFY